MLCSGKRPEGLYHARVYFYPYVGRRVLEEKAGKGATAGAYLKKRFLRKWLYRLSYFFSVGTVMQKMLVKLWHLVGKSLAVCRDRLRGRCNPLGEDALPNLPVRGCGVSPDVLQSEHLPGRTPPARAS